MRVFSKAIGLLAFSWCLLLSPIGLSYGGELIAPSRTLEEPGQKWGRLAVFSEPPELEVFLNEEKVGRTPLWLERVTAGPYLLKVGGGETEITVNENKSLKIGLFKGSFVAFPEGENETTQPTVDAKGPDQTKKMEPGQEERRAKDLTMWEVLVGGSSIRLWDSKN